LKNTKNTSKSRIRS